MSLFKSFLQGKYEVAMSEAVHLQAYPMYFYGMTKICIPDFFGGRGDISWHLTVGYAYLGAEHYGFHQRCKRFPCSDLPLV